MKTNNTRRLTLLTLALVTLITANAQDGERSSSSIYLNPVNKTEQTLITFSTEGEGHRFSPVWGLDEAWISEQNLRKGLNHMGKDNIGIGRSTFRTNKALVNDSALTTDQINVMKQRINLFNIIDKTLPIVLTADQDAGSDEYFVKNKSADVDHWAACINSHVHWLQKNTDHPVVGVSPFNEPDYWTVEEGATKEKQRDVARILKNDYPRMKDVAIVGANTLNDDKALDWYLTGREYYDWGNTHQLAGSFDNFVKFYQQLASDGKVGYGDEMHNVGEAMIGLEYGMTVGIWWGFDSRARGEFCDISRNGERLAYAENRNNWTVGSVYRHDDGRMKAFLGSSERQAKNTSFKLLSKDRDVYFDGYGPMREFSMDMPGGTAYQTGQTNAERVIDITWGEDVAPRPIESGVYKIINKATGNAASVSGDNIVQQKYTGTNLQKWNVKACDPRIGGDYSFYDFESVSNNQLRMNILNFQTTNNTNVMAYSKNATPSSNEQWYLQYAGDGYYFIRSRETALYLTSASSYSINNVNVMTYERYGDDKIARQMWRLLPAETEYETTPPAQPEGLTATRQPSSVRLEWTMGTDSDLDGYMVLRAPEGTGQWNTIARLVKTAYYVDNTCDAATSYIYKVKAIDLADNQSQASETVIAPSTDQKALIGCWQMEGNLNDLTVNMMDAKCNSNAIYSTNCKEGTKALMLNASAGHYLQLPYAIANSDELSIALWVNWRNSNGNWQRIFDFGNGTDQYLFLTPSNGSIMRFAIKNGGDEQTVDCSTKLTLNQWKHVAVTIGREKTVIYIDGQEAASSTGVTIRPSDIRPVLNYLGRSQFYSDALFTGYLDDVRIYNYALSASDVVSVMNGEMPVGIESTTVDGSMPEPVFDLTGRRLPHPVPGINIIGRKKVVF